MQKIIKNTLIGMIASFVALGANAKDNTDSNALAQELKNLEQQEYSDVAPAQQEEVLAGQQETVAPDTEKDVVQDKQENIVTESEPEPVPVAMVEPLQIAAPEEASNPEIAFPHGMQIGFGLSATTGVNGFIGYNNKKFDSFWWKRLGVRADFATMSPLKSTIRKTVDRFTEDDGGFELDDDLYVNNFELKSHHFAGMIDIYPFGDTWFLGGWRLTGGYYFGKTELSADLTGKVDGAPGEEFEFEFDGKKYRYQGNEVSGKAKVAWDFSGPYVGTGFDLGLFAGFKIYLDAGVVFTSKTAALDLDVNPDNLKVETAPGVWKPLTPDALGAAYADKIDEFNARKAATLKDAQDELDKIDFYPIVKLGFMYRF